MKEKANDVEYAAHAKATGGRRGRVWTETGSIDSRVTPPGVETNGVTPEELLAAAWGACYGGAYAFEARAAGVTTDPEFAVEVVLDVEDGYFEITRAVLTVLAPNENQAIVREVAEKAHARCPVSKVLAGGIGELRVGTGSHG